MKTILSRGVHEHEGKRAIRVINNFTGKLTIPEDNYFGWVEQRGLFKPYSFNGAQNEIDKFIDLLPEYANAYLLDKTDTGFLVSTITINPNILDEYKNVEGCLQMIQKGNLQKSIFNFYLEGAKNHLKVLQWPDWKRNIKL